MCFLFFWGGGKFTQLAQILHVPQLCTNRAQCTCTHIDAHKGCILMHTQTGGRESVPAAARLSVTHMVRINH